jgi:hypothetical protein
MPQDPIDADGLAKDILDRLVRATWIKQYTYTDGKGYDIGWSPHGGMTAMALKEWRKKLDLGGGDGRPLILDIFAHGLSPDPASEPATVMAALQYYVTSGLCSRAIFKPKIGCDIVWTDFGRDFLKNFAVLIDKLKISGDQDRLIIFFSLIECWAPDWDTPTNIRGNLEE